MEKTLSCRKCGFACFVQKEIRRTKVVIIGGKALQHAPYRKNIASYFFCARCGAAVPKEEGEAVKMATAFSEENN
jgi:ribosomal protein S26